MSVAIGPKNDKAKGSTKTSKSQASTSKKKEDK